MVLIIHFKIFLINLIYCFSPQYISVLAEIPELHELIGIIKILVMLSIFLIGQPKNIFIVVNLLFYLV